MVNSLTFFCGKSFPFGFQFIYLGDLNFAIYCSAYSNFAQVDLKLNVMDYSLKNKALLICSRKIYCI